MRIVINGGTRDGDAPREFEESVRGSAHHCLDVAKAFGDAKAQIVSVYIL